MTVVIPRESGVSSTPQRIDSITAALEYWITRWSLSSGGACADPVAGDDVCGASRKRNSRIPKRPYSR
jgi:hypothetical protein